MKDRKNPNPPRKERTVVERGYFHTGNSGISISLVEEHENYDWDTEDRNWYNHYLEIRHSAQGAGTSIRTPIAGPVACDYYINAFTRLRDRMLADPLYRLPSTFERYPHDGLANRIDGIKGAGDVHRVSDIENGLQRREKWSEEVVVDCYSTSQRLLAHDFVDPKTGQVVRTEPFEGVVERGSASAGSGPTYLPSAIGKPLALVEAETARDFARLRLNAGIDKPVRDNAVTISNSISVQGTISTNVNTFANTERALRESIAAMTALLPQNGKALSSDEFKQLQQELIDLRAEMEELDLSTSSDMEEPVSPPPCRVEMTSRAISRDTVIEAYQWLHNNDPGGLIIYGGQTYPLDGSSNVIAVVIADQMTDPDNNDNQTIWVKAAKRLADHFNEAYGE